MLYVLIFWKAWTLWLKKQQDDEYLLTTARPYKSLVSVLTTPANLPFPAPSVVYRSAVYGSVGTGGFTK